MRERIGANRIPGLQALKGFSYKNALALALFLSLAFIFAYTDQALAVRLIDESFEGAGYEEGWTETTPDGPGTLDEDSAIPGTAPTGSGSQCLKSVSVSPNYKAFADRDLGSTYGTTFTRTYVYVDAEGLSDGDKKDIVKVMDDANNVLYYVQLYQAAGNLYFRLRIYVSSGSGYQNYDTLITLANWYRVEVKYDWPGTAWEWRIDGTMVNNGTLSVGAYTGIQTWRCGLARTAQGYTGTVYYDLFAVDDADWVGEEPDPGARMIDENFEGAGYEEPWTEVLDSGCTLYEDALIPGTAPSGSGNECLKTVVLDATDGEAYAYQVKTDEDISYVRGYLYVDQEGLNDGQSLFTLGLLDSSDLTVAGIEIGQSGGGLVLRYQYYSSGTLNSTANFPINLGTWYRVEYRYDITNSAWELRMDGVTKASGALAASTQTPSQMVVGISGHGGAATTILYTDLAAWDTTGWIGEEPTGNIITVCQSGCDYTTIQPALAAANSGDTVKVMDSATYSSSGGSPINMKTGVDLVTNTGVTPTINGAFYPAVSFIGPVNNCTLKGFTITGGMLAQGGQVNVNGLSGAVSNVTILDCVVDATSWTAPPGGGIVLRGAVGPTIRNTQILNSYSTGITPTSSGTVLSAPSPIRIMGCDIKAESPGGLGGAGIRIVGDGSSAIEVIIDGTETPNVIHDNPQAGIFLANFGAGSVVTIDGNVIENNGSRGPNAGIVLDKIPSATIKRNTIRGNGKAGVSINGDLAGQDITVGGPLAPDGSRGDGNEIYNNALAGVGFGGCATCTSPATGAFLVEGNHIHNNQAGVFVEGTIDGTATITQNDIYANTRGGIGLNKDCELVITKNNIHDNTRAGIHTGKTTGGFGGTMGGAILHIRQNKIYQNGGSAIGVGIDVRYASGEIENNLVYNNHRGGIRFGWEDLADPHITDIRNNTVVSNGEGGIVYDDLAGDFDDPPAGNPPGPLLIRNNISVYNEKAGIRACFDNIDYIDLKPYRDHNLLFDNFGCVADCARRCEARQLGKWTEDGSWYCPYASGYSWASNDICGLDPLFKNMTNGDYRLQRISEGDLADSPAIDAGDDGTDMGAYGGTYPIVDSEIPDFSS